MKKIWFLSLLLSGVVIADTEFEELLKQAEQGDAESQYQLGSRYDFGNDLPEDNEKAVHWYREAASQGHAAAQTSLGSMLFDGEGVEQDQSQARLWWEKSAMQGNAKAQYNLGLYYDDDGGEHENNYEAVQWYRRSAVQGFAPAQYVLGWMYSEGEGVELDNVEAVKWFREAANRGFAPAQHNLGYMYATGQGVLENIQEAYVWFGLAAMQGEENSAAARDKAAEFLAESELEEANHRMEVLAGEIQPFDSEEFAADQGADDAKVNMPVTFTLGRPISVSSIVNGTKRTAMGEATIKSLAVTLMTPISREQDAYRFRVEAVTSRLMEMAGLPALMEPVMVELTASTTGLSYEYSADVTGYPLSLVDSKQLVGFWKEVEERMLRWSADYGKTAGFDDAVTEQVNAVLAAHFQPYSDPGSDTFDELHLKSDRNLFYATGRELYRYYLTAVPSTRFFRDSQIYFHTTDHWNVDSFDEEAKRSVISFRQDLNREEFEQFLTRLEASLLEQHGEEQRQWVDSVMGIWKKFEFTRSGEYLMDLESGLPIRGVIHSHQALEGEVEEVTHEFVMAPHADNDPDSWPPLEKQTAIDSCRQKIMTSAYADFQRRQGQNEEAIAQTPFTSLSKADQQEAMAGMASYLQACNCTLDIVADETPWREYVRDHSGDDRWIHARMEEITKSGRCGIEEKVVGVSDSDR